MTMIKKITRLFSISAIFYLCLSMTAFLGNEKPFPFRKPVQSPLVSMLEQVRASLPKMNEAQASFSGYGSLITTAVYNMKAYADPLSDSSACTGGVVAALVCVMNQIIVHVSADGSGIRSTTTPDNETIVLSPSSDPDYAYNFSVTTSGGTKTFNLFFTADGTKGYVDTVSVAPSGPTQDNANRIAWDATDMSAAVITWIYQGQSTTSHAWSDTFQAGKFVATVNSSTNTAKIEAVEFTTSPAGSRKYTMYRNSSHTVSKLETYDSGGSTLLTSNYECYENAGGTDVFEDATQANLSGNANCSFAVSANLALTSTAATEANLGLFSTSGGAPFSLK